MKYVDGFVLAVANDKKEAYIKHSQEAAKVFKEYGVLSLVESWGDEVPDGEITSFPLAVKCKDNETVCFSWLTWPSKKVRDENMAKIMEDPRMHPDNNPMPFDGKRMIFGGFEVIVEM